MVGILQTQTGAFPSSLPGDGKGDRVEPASVCGLRAKEGLGAATGHAETRLFFPGTSQDLEQFCKRLLAEGWVLYHQTCKMVKVSCTAAFSRSGHGSGE